MLLVIILTSNSHDYTATLPCYESISYEIKESQICMYN